MGHRLKECINAALWQRVHMWNVAHPMVWYSTCTTVFFDQEHRFCGVIIYYELDCKQKKDWQY